MRSASSMFLKVPAYDDDGIDHESQTPPEQVPGRPAARSRRATSADDFGLVLVYFRYLLCMATSRATQLPVTLTRD